MLLSKHLLLESRHIGLLLPRKSLMLVLHGLALDRDPLPLGVHLFGVFGETLALSLDVRGVLLV